MCVDCRLLSEKQIKYIWHFEYLFGCASAPQTIPLLVTDNIYLYENKCNNNTNITCARNVKTTTNNTFQRTSHEANQPNDFGHNRSLSSNKTVAATVF